MEQKTLHQKLLEVQKELGAVVKNKENPFFKSKYADINAFIETLKPVLNKYELVLTQPLDNIDGRPALTTTVSDDIGSLKSTITLPDLEDPQKMGSAITYYRRYALQSLFCMQAEDDDANVASGKEGFSV